MSLSYSYIDWQYPLPPPPRKVNGGLYTGTPARGLWGNFPVVPEPNELEQNLLSANPPPNAEKLPITYNREGNNHVTYPHYGPLGDIYGNIYCRKN